MWRVVLVLFTGMFPTAVQAAVSISEVAWMGSAESANYEWIELHNDGAAIDVTGWHVNDGVNLDITLSGVIAADSYVVLERSSDASAPGSAFMIYTGALVNTGATLSLARVDGSLVDQVSGGEDWENIGGDNVTKETAQYTASGWVTAAATPGRGITTTEIQVAQAKSESASVRKTDGGPLAKPVEVTETKLVLPGITLELAISAPKTVYVNQDITFLSSASGIGDHLIDSLLYEWNFGDGSVSSGSETTHYFTHPGTYAVVLYASFKRQEQIARHTITVLPVALSLTTNSVGDLQINNDSPYELDLSGYRVVGAKEVLLPPRTILLPNQTITLSKKRIGSTDMVLAVYDAQGESVALKLPKQLQTENEIELAYADSAVTFYPVIRDEMPEKSTEFPLAQSVEVSEVTTAPSQSPAGAAPRAGGESWPYYAFGALLVVGTFGVLVAPRPPKPTESVFFTESK